jgi:hypothetical protein
MSCSLVLSFHQFIFEFFQFALLLDLVFLDFLKPFFLLVAGSRIFLSLFVVVVLFVVLPLVLCLQPHRHHRHLHEHLVV